MKQKRIFLLLAFILLAIILLGSSLSTDNTQEVSGNNYDSAYYVDGSRNLFIMTAKFIDKCCFYVIDAVVSGVGNVFGSILNN